MKMLVRLIAYPTRFHPPFCGIQVEIFVEVTDTNVPIAAAKAWTDGEIDVLHCGRTCTRVGNWPSIWVRSI